jgi:hypothetical protein
MLVPSAGADCDHLTLLRLLLGRIRDDDAAGRLLLGIDAADHNTVMQGAKLHV